jgi:hypothetical protein
LGHVAGALACAALASGVVASGGVSGRALAQSPPAAVNTLKDLGAALRACWVPPPIDQSRPGMQITVMMSFRRNGELLGQPRITFESAGATDDDRLAYRTAVAEMLKRCSPLPFTDGFGNAAAGRPFTMRFIDDRKLKQAGTGYD